MKRKVQKPFSLKKEEWKNEAKLETRDGKTARILATDIKGPRPIAAALYYEEDNEELVYYYTEDGFFKSRQEEAWIGDWNPRNENKLYVIVSPDDEIATYDNWNAHRVLSFPTPEMRDEFLKRFEDLIQMAKDLI